MKIGKRHLMIPDTQIRKGVDISHIVWVAHYAEEMDCDTVVMIGDWWDFPSLSSYDKRGSAKAEGRRVRDDIDAGNNAMDIMQDIWDDARYSPRKVFCMGNHEARLHRAINDNPAELEGVLSEEDLAVYRNGWDVRAFLDPVSIDGITYSHFFPHNADGKVLQTKNGAPSAKAQARRQMRSAFAGHQQGLDIAYLNNGIRGVIAGSFYLHDEEYIGPKSANDYWRGAIVANEVKRGKCDIMPVSIEYLKARYGNKTPKKVKA